MDRIEVTQTATDNSVRDQLPEYYPLRDSLFPQYDVLADFMAWMESPAVRGWRRREARRLLNKAGLRVIMPTPEVIAHWEKLAK